MYIGPKYMHVGTVFFSFWFYVFSDSARPVTFSPPSWILLTFTYVVSMHPRQNILEYWPINPNIPEDTITFMISTMPDVIRSEIAYVGAMIKCGVLQLDE